MANILTSEKEFFKKECDKTVRSCNRVQQGKGSRSRTDTFSPKWRDNYDLIFGKKKKSYENK